MKISEIKIGKRYRKDAGDLTDLKESIQMIGLLHPVVIDDKGNLIAGFRRLMALKELNYEDVPVTTLPLEDILKGEFDENTIRKDFSPTEKLAILKALERHPGKRTDLKKDQPPAKLAGGSEPRKRASKLLNTSPSTLSKISKVVAYGDEEIIQEMDRTGKIDQAARKVKAEIAQEERLSKAAAVSEEQKQNLRNTCRIECKDIRLLLPQEITDVKAVITDPPYPSEFLPLFEDLAKLCINVPVVAVMSGQNWFPFAMGLLCRHLKYRWLLSYLTPGKTYDAKDRGMASTWKPILLFGEKIKNNVRDVYVSAVPDKEYHEWGQSLSGMMDIVSCLTEPGDLVLDPFVGGGATAEACVRLNRRFIGYDIDQNFVDKSWNRCLIASEEMKKEAQSDNRQV